MRCGAETMEDPRGYFRRCQKFEYLGVKIDKEGRQENYIKDRINQGRAITAMLNSVLWNRKIARKNQLTNSMVYGTRRFNAAFTRALQ